MAKSVRQLLDGQQLRTIIKKAQVLETVNHLLASVLESELQNHCLAINFQSDTLVLAVDGAAWLVRLKFLSSQLVSALRQHPSLRELRQLQFYIQPAHPETSRQYWKKNALSATHAKMIAEMAIHINDERLKKALLKLATSGRE